MSMAAGEEETERLVKNGTGAVRHQPSAEPSTCKPTGWFQPLEHSEHLVGVVSQRRQSAFLRPPDHSCAVVAVLTLHHGEAKVAGATQVRPEVTQQWLVNTHHVATRVPVQEL